MGLYHLIPRGLVVSNACSACIFTETCLKPSGVKSRSSGVKSRSCGVKNVGRRLLPKNTCYVRLWYTLVAKILFDLVRNSGYARILRGSKKGLGRRIAMAKGKLKAKRLHSADTLYRGQSYMEKVKAEPVDLAQQLQDCPYPSILTHNPQLSNP